MLDLRLFGTPVLMGPDGPVSGRAAYKRRMALLSVLAVARGRPVGRERLMALLWPEHSASAARHSLSVSLHVLRKELGEGIVLSVGDDVALAADGPLRTDVQTFQNALDAGRLEAAVALYGGPLLEGFHVSDAPEFERWVDGERDRLARAYVDALERLAAHAADAGGGLAAVDLWRRLVAAEPYSSRAALRLAQSLEAAGERAAALRTVEAHAARLRDELGVEADPELAAFAGRLRAEPRPGPSADAPAGRPQGATPPAAIVPGAAPGGAAPGEPGSTTATSAVRGPAERSSAPAASAEGGPDAPAAATAEAADPASAGRASADRASASRASAEWRSADAATADAAGADAAGADRRGADVDTGMEIRHPEPSASEAVAPKHPPAGTPAGARASVEGWPSVDRRVRPEPIPSVVAARLARPGDGAPYRRRMAVLAAGLGLMVLAGAVFLPSLRTYLDGGGNDPRRIAVLYFSDDSPGRDLGYLASGLTAELIDALGRVPALDVVPQSAVKAYRDGGVTLDSLVRALDVGTLVEGSVLRRGDSVRVAVRVFDARKQSRLETRSVVRGLDDLPALNAAVEGEIASALRRRVGRQVVMRRMTGETRSREALSLVLRAEDARDQATRVARGRHVHDVVSASVILAGADTLLARAERADPHWARPAALRARIALSQADVSPPRDQPRLLQAALGHARRALLRDPGHADARVIRARVAWRLSLAAENAAEERRWRDDAERDARAALETDDGNAEAWATLAMVLRLHGRQEEAALAEERALEGDAFLEHDEKILTRQFFGAMSRGDYASARALCARGRTAFRDGWRAVECRLVLLREDPSLAPDAAQAWALLAELDRLDPPSRARAGNRPYAPLGRRMAVASVLARAGAADSARAVVGRVRVEAAGDRELVTSLLYDEAYVALLSGDRPGARRLLDRYLAAHPTMRDYVARDAAFAGLFGPAPVRR